MTQSIPQQTSNKTAVHIPEQQNLYKLEHLTTIFNDEFRKENTILRHGADEPFYQASNSQHGLETPAVIHSTHDYFSSALHEIAHWCVAGSARRELDDYGYWYAPDGRSYEQQQEFYKVEVKPQALEWAFAMASQHEFQVSLDNLDYAQSFPQQSKQDSIHFEQSVLEQLNYYIAHGFPERAQRLIQRLTQSFGGAVKQVTIKQDKPT